MCCELFFHEVYIVLTSQVWPFQENLTVFVNHFSQRNRSRALHRFVLSQDFILC